MAVSNVPTAPGRARPARPARSVKRPEIKLAAAPEESRWVGPLPLAIGLIALAATLGFAHRLGGKVEDENYARAKESLSQYELGRPESERNYDSSLYQDALAALAKVDHGSISAGPADSLAADIQLKTEAFHRRIRAREAAQSVAQQAYLDRDREFLAAQQRDLLTAVKSYPECKHEESTHGR